MPGPFSTPFLTSFGNGVCSEKHTVVMQSLTTIKVGDRIQCDVDGRDVVGVITRIKNSISQDGSMLYMEVDVRSEADDSPVPPTCWERLLADD
jgi:hypothetical protein